VAAGASEEVPETRFASLGADRIAYQFFGEGDSDLLWVSSGDPIDLRWELPAYASFLRRLGGQARVIMFDRRGSGSSDSASGEALSSWERWADEARAVLDAVGSERAVLFGTSDGAPMSILFAASHPVRTRGLVLANTAAGFAGAPVPTEVTATWDERATAEFVAQAWGTPALAEFVCPDAARDPAFVRWLGRAQRLSYSPRDVGIVVDWVSRIDVRDALGSVRVPTLVLHREGFEAIPVDHGRYLAEHIPGARLAVLPGRDSFLFTEPSAEGLGHIEEFLRGLHGVSESDRALAAILFTDFVESTKQLSAVGDRAWRNLLDSHDVIARTVVEQHGGHLVRTTGDGILAIFDGPGRAIRCTTALGDALQALGVEIRAGLHTGEVERRGTEIAGIAVHIAARVLEAADGGELLVSAAVPMLVAGSGFEFEDRGEHELKGVSGTWQLYAVKS
jgi:class 3 adenylate cyclase